MWQGFFFLLGHSKECLPLAKALFKNPPSPCDLGSMGEA